MLGTIATIASGGIMGMIGSVIGKGFALFDQYQQSKSKQQAWQHELNLLELKHRYQQENDVKMMQQEQEKQETQLQIASYHHDSSVGQGSIWVIDVLRLVRPILTLGLVFLTALVWFSAESTEPELRKEITNTILFCTTAALTWWFGDRTRR